MRRTTLLVALVVVVGMLAVPTMGALAQEAENESDDQMAPGERLSGVVGVQSAEIDGEIERNAFAIGLERADDNATKARQIADKLNETEGRLAELDERKTQLQEQRENGTITEGQYRARMAKLATETETAKQQLNQSNATAARLPAETLEANGVNASAIRTLMNNASEMSGDEVSEIARSIAGDRSGMVDRGAPGERGPGNDRGPDRAGDRGPGEDSPDNQTDVDQNDAGGESTADEQQDDSEDGEMGDGTDNAGSGSEDAETNGDASGDAESSGSQNGGSAGGNSGNAGSR